MDKKQILPDYEGLHKWEYYPADAENEYQQCFDEGLSVEPYKQLFAEVQKMPRSNAQKMFGDALFELTRSLEKREGISTSNRPITIVSSLSGRVIR